MVSQSSTANFGLPGTPSPPTVTAGDSSLQVSWSSLSAPSSSPITQVTASAGGQSCHPNPVTALSCVITGLTSLQTYTVTVSAINVVGTATSNATSGKPITPASALRAINNGNSGISVSWVAASGNPSGSFTYSAVATDMGPSATGTSSSCPTTTGTSCVIQGLTPGDSYSVKLSESWDSSGDAVFVNYTNPSTNDQVLVYNAPSTVVQAESVGSPAGSQTIDVTWTAPTTTNGNAIASYGVAYKDVTANAQSFTPVTYCSNLPSSTLSCAISGLVNGDSYAVQVTASNGIASASVVSGIVPYGPASSPRSVVVAAGTSATAAVSWTAPSSFGGSGLYDYVATASSPGQPAETCSSTATHCLITGLTPGVTYGVSVAVINGPNSTQGYTTSSPTTNFTSFQSSDPVVGLQVLNGPYAGDQTLAVSWSAAAPSTLPIAQSPAVVNYVVTVTDQTSASQAQTCTVDASAPLTCTFTSLVDGDNYLVSVVSFNGAYSATSVATSAPFGPPGALAAPVVTNGIDSTLAVSWTPVAAHGSPVSYTAVATDAITQATSSCTVSAPPTSTSCQINGLTNGDLYQVTLSAQNAYSTNIASSPQVLVFGAPSSATGVTVQVGPSIGSGEVSVTWSAPSSTNGSAISKYVAQAILSSGAPSVAGSCTVDATSSPKTSCAIIGLQNGVAYSVVVQSFNGPSGGPSEFSTSAASPASPFTNPSSVTNLAAGVGSSAIPVNWSQSALVTWSAPLTDGGRRLTGYTITLTAPDGSQSTYPVSATTTSYKFTGLTNGGNYRVTIEADTSFGAYSTTSLSFIPYGAPDAPTNVSIIGGAVAGSQSLNVTWNASANTNGRDLTQYVVTATPVNGSANSGTCTTSATSSPPVTLCSIRGLTNGALYTVTVTAYNDPGSFSASAPSGPANPYTTPSAVTGVTLSVGATADQSKSAIPGIRSDGSGAIFVTWLPPSSNGGQALSSYTATAYQQGVAVGSCTTGGTYCFIEGLTNGLQYSVTVIGTNGASSFGPAATSSTTVSPYGAPSAVQNIQAVCIPGLAKPSICKSGQIIYTWAPPVQTNGRSLTNYVLTLIDGNGNTVTTVSVPASSARSYSFGNLVNGAPYVLQVQASNDATSPSSISVSATADPYSPFTTPSAISLQKSNVVSDTGIAGSLLVSWTPAYNGGSPVTFYEAQVMGVNGGPSGPGVGLFCTAPLGATSCVISGLENGANYQVVVFEANADGLGSASNIQNGTPKGPPSGGELIAMPGPQTISVTLANLNVGQELDYSVAWSYAACAPNTVCDPTSANFDASQLTFVPVPQASGCTTTPASLATIPQCQISGLDNGTSYLVQAVVSTTIAGANNLYLYPPTLITPTGFPGVPVNITATLSNASAVVTWSPPANDGGSPITQYTVSAVPGVGAPCTVQVSDGTPLSCQFNGLTFGVAYTFYVIAQNAAGPGTGAYSPSYVDGAAVAPTNVQVQPVDQGLIVSWTPSVPNGFPILSYVATAIAGSHRYQCTTGGKTQPTASCVIPVPNCPNTSAACPRYSVSVAASNEVGGIVRRSGQAAATSTAVVNGVPGAPTNVTVLPLATALHVSWSAPANPGSGVTLYVVTAKNQIAADGSSYCTLAPPFPPTGPLSCDVSKLQLGQSFVVSVQAFDSIGGGGSSAAIPATTSNAPAPATSLVVIPQSSSFVVTWLPYQSFGPNAASAFVVKPNSPLVACDTTSVTVQSGGRFAELCSSAKKNGVIPSGSAFTFSITAVNTTGGKSSPITSSTVKLQQSLQPGAGSTGPTLDLWQASGGGVLPIPGGEEFGPDGTLYTTEEKTGQVLVTPPGTSTPTAELVSSVPLKAPSSIALSPDGKFAYVVDASLGEVVAIPTAGGSASVVSITGLSTPLNNPTGIALIGGTLYISDSGNNRIVAVATNGGAGVVVGSQVRLTGNEGICALPNGNLLVANTQSSSLVILNPINGAATTLPVFDTIKATPFVHPISVAVSRNGGTYFVGLTNNQGSGTVVEMNSSGGNFSVVSSGIQGLNAIALSAAGQLAFNGNLGVSTESF